MKNILLRAASGLLVALLLATALVSCGNEEASETEMGGEEKVIPYYDYLGDEKLDSYVSAEDYKNLNVKMPSKTMPQTAYDVAVRELLVAEGTYLDELTSERLVEEGDIVSVQYGEVISGVAGRAKAQNVPVVALVGCVGEESRAIYDAGISAVFTINRRPQDLRRSRRFSAINYRRSFADILRLILAMK